VAAGSTPAWAGGRNSLRCVRAHNLAKKNAIWIAEVGVLLASFA